MSDFKITDDRMSLICSHLGIVDAANMKMVRDLYRDFSYFYDSNVRTQHLAPIVMAMERYVQEAYKRKNFKIAITQMRECSARCGIAFLQWDVNRYDICIPANTDTITVNNIVAHELGHLFYVMNCLYEKDVPDLANDGCLADKMADVIGIFTMANRADYYETKAHSTCQSDFQSILHDFMKMGRGRRCSKNPLRGTER